MDYIIVFIIGYVLVCTICAQVAEKKSIGVTGCFFICLFFTPIIGLLVGALSPYPPKEEKIKITKPKKECKNCNLYVGDNDVYCSNCGWAQ